MNFSRANSRGLRAASWRGGRVDLPVPPPPHIDDLYPRGAHHLLKVLGLRVHRRRDVVPVIPYAPVYGGQDRELVGVVEDQPADLLQPGQGVLLKPPRDNLDVPVGQDHDPLPMPLLILGVRYGD